MNSRIKIAIALGITGALLWFAGVYFSEENQEEPTSDEVKESFSESAKGAASYWSIRRSGTGTPQEFQKKLSKIKSQLASKPRLKSSSMTWKELGPDNVGGRTRALLIDNENYNRIYAGGVSGGLWYSNNKGLTWNPTTPGDDSEVLTVTCITQDPEGYIYYGTGEGGFYQELGNGTGGYRGQGLFKSTEPHGTEFVQLTGSLVNGFDQEFNSINEIVSDANGVLYCAAEQGIHKSTDAGLTWEALFSGVLAFRKGWDVKVDSQNRVYAVLGSGLYKSESGVALSFTELTGNGGLPESEGRMEIAIAPSDDNYIYAISSDDDNNDKLQGVWQSKDGGLNWTALISGSSDVFDPFTTGDGSFGQGTYDNVIVVHPENKEEIFIGGVTFWKWKKNANWERIASTVDDHDAEKYVHVDMHAIVFAPDNPDQIYVGTDGGIFRTDDAGERWQRMNRKYNITQFYAIGYDAIGPVIGGTQDNSNQYLNFSGISAQNAVKHSSGDGGYSEISSLNSARMIVESQYGRIVRSSNKGTSYSEFFEYPSSNNNGNAADYNPNFAPFVAPLLLWETQNNTIIKDTLKFVAEEDMAIGDTVRFVSDIDGRVLDSILIAPLFEGMEIERIDPFQNVLLFGTNEGVYMTREVNDFTKTPTWLRIATNGTSYINGRGVTEIAIASDGNTAYYGTTEGRLYRIDSLLYAMELNQSLPVTELASFSAAVTGISVDPSDADNILVTIGSYSNITHIYNTTNATQIVSSSVSNFTAVQGDLPNFPVYDALIEKGGNGWLIATEFGVFYSSDNGVSWNQAGDFPNVPTLMVRQQVYPWAINHGLIYVATHGRGLFSTDDYQLPVSTEKIVINNKEAPFKVFPNPVLPGNEINFEYGKNLFSANLQIRVTVFDINGKLSLQTIQNKANQTLKIPSHFKSGIYMIQLSQEERSYWGKLVVR